MLPIYLTNMTELEKDERIEDLMELVGVAIQEKYKFAIEFSGGQLFAYYEFMDRNMSSDEITDMCFGMMIGNKKGGQLSRFNLNNKLVRKIFHTLFRLRAKKLNRHKKDGSWNNTWGMEVNPLNHKEGISIHLVGCPIADFAKKNGYSELMPYFCEADKVVIEHFGGTLYREHTVADGYEDCDYWIKNKGE